jgi:predicted XRE-type DNA-binding protein
MTSDGDVEPVFGSGNLFRDLEWRNSEAQAQGHRGRKVLKVLDDQALRMRKDQALTGIDHGDSSRVLRAKFDRLTVERLIVMLAGLGQ